MKKLIFLRHGKSDWEAPYGGDHERPLNERGRRAAQRMGSFLTAVRSAPDVVVSSTAVRALRTAELAAEAGAWGCPILRTRELYDASPEAVLTVVRRQDDAHRIVLLAGHEPTWSESLSRLIGGGEVKMVTAAAARVEVELDSWNEIAFGIGRLDWLVTPKLLDRVLSDD